VIRLRYVIVAFWVVATVVAMVALPTLEDTQVGGLGDLVPRNADAIEAEQRSHELFGFPLLSRTVVVQRDADGLSAAAQGRVLARAYRINRALLPGLEDIAGAIPVTNALGRPPFSRERSTTALTFLFFEPEISRTRRAELTEELRERDIARPDDAYVGATGALSARQESSALIKDALPTVELATVLLVLAAVGLHFRSLVAPLANLATVVVAYLISLRVIALIGEAVDVSVPREITPVIVVLLLGVLTDYSIFYLSRYRRLLGDGVERTAAAERSARELGPIILTAGTSIVAASSALLIAQLGFLQAFGPGMAIAVLIGMLVALTFTPALLAVAGPAVFWPRRPRRDSDPVAAPDEQLEREKGGRGLGLATRYPAATTLACMAVLLAAATGLQKLEVGHPLVRGLPEDNPVRTSYRAASQGFTPGVLAPTVAIVEQPGVASRRADLAKLQRLLRRQRGVAAVAGPASVPFEVNVGATVAENGDAARYVLVLRHDPLGAAAVNTLTRIERRMPRLLARAGLPDARVSFAGDTALVAETVEKTFDDLARVAPVAILAVLLVLVVFLRALVAPLYLVFASVLAVAAALGLTAYFFVGLLGHTELTYYAPFTVAVLLIALGSDYNVFIVGRIWQQVRSLPLRQAIVVGGTRAARPITVAGVILGLSFALLALVPLQGFREIAFAMTTGLLIDAFLVRTLLVPALIALFGEAGGWPGRRLRARPARATSAR
jgi:RND superfamily putative drug exporter